MNNDERKKDDMPESYDDGAKENMSLWDIANMEAGTDIDETGTTEDVRYHNYGEYTMVNPDDGENSVVDTSGS